MSLRFERSTLRTACALYVCVFATACSLVVDANEDELPPLAPIDLGVASDAGSDAGMDSAVLDDAGPDIDAELPDANLEIDMHVEVDLGPCGAAGCPIISASNVDDALWDDEADDLQIRGGGVARMNTDTCNLMSADGIVVTQEGGTSVCVLKVRDFTVESVSSLSVTGSIPLVIMATGNVRIDGEIDVSAHEDATGPGGGLGGTIDVIDGWGDHPGIAGAHVDDYDDGGGGGGGYCGAGGAGGAGGEAEGGAGGSASGATTLEPLRGGSGGGRGRGLVEDDDSNAGMGGAGGGAIQISSLQEIIINGSIFAGGGGGGGGTRELGTNTNFGSGGGGGSGGAVLLEAPSVSFASTASLVVSGGGGGAASTTGFDGSNGHDGAFGAMPSAGGISLGMGAPGGDGANRTNIAGTAGGSRPSLTNGGGGGGGGGCVVIRNMSGALSGTDVNVNPSSGALQVLPMHTR